MKGAKYKLLWICYFFYYMLLFNLSINHIHLSKDNFKFKGLVKRKIQMTVSGFSKCYCILSYPSYFFLPYMHHKWKE